MKRCKSLLAAGLVMLGYGFSSACGSDGDPAALGVTAAGAGARAAAAGPWRGIQSCRGQQGQTALPTSSDETMLDGYSKTATRVQLRGVRLGPQGEFSCAPLDFETVITHDDGGLTMFSSDAKKTCLLPAGRSLIVNGIAGSLVDVGIDRTLQLHATILDSGDAGLDNDLSLICQVELHESAR